MESNPKGHALILNINNIKYRDERKGSDVDMANLIKLFEGLGYIVHAKVDLTERVNNNLLVYLINIKYSNKIPRRILTFKLFFICSNSRKLLMISLVYV